MLDHPRFWNLASRVSGLVSGATLHHAALRALHRGDHAGAASLFERAAERYRAELEPERLARLRVHELIGRVRARTRDGEESSVCLEVERLLCRLDQIESLEPPFTLVSAHSMLATWYGAAAGASATETASDLLARAA
jgi:hypothetical protein